MKKISAFSLFVLLSCWLGITITAAQESSQAPETIRLGEEIAGTLEEGERRPFAIEISEEDLPVDIIMHSPGDASMSLFDLQGDRIARADRAFPGGFEAYTVEPGGQMPTRAEVRVNPGSTSRDFLLSILPSETRVSETPRPGEQVKQWAELDVETSRGDQSVTLPYLLYLPEDYNASESYPLLLFLHGAGEGGVRLDFLKNQVLPKLIEDGEDYPFVIASPQLGYQEDWPRSVDALAALIAQLQSELPIDPDRVYIAGISMGGHGAWHFALTYPSLPAAVVSVAGFYTYGSSSPPANICDLADIPMWVSHSEQDELVPLIWEQVLVDALSECGGNVQFTVYPDANHSESFIRAFEDRALYDWLLQQQR